MKTVDQASNKLRTGHIPSGLSVFYAADQALPAEFNKELNHGRIGK